MKHKPKLTLVGAGPGDPDLISVKGLKALKKAKVVLYDALVNRDLLDYAPQALKIDVGKRKGVHRYKQEKINELIVQYGHQFGEVVRLKGGDPYVFGRGSEEIAYAEHKGFDTEVIPGISSSIAVPSGIGIPLTQRGVSESFWVITACTSEKRLSADIALAAQSKATIVILMGLGKLGEIVRLFQRLDKGNFPVAVIQNGTLPSQKSVIGTVDDIILKVEKHRIASPAIILMGEVVAHKAKAQQVISECLLHHAS